VTNPQIKQKVTKEEVNKLPMISFKGKTLLIDSEEALKKHLKKITNIVLQMTKESCIGFDTESRPSFKKGQCFPISLLQISTLEDAILFRTQMVQLPKIVVDLLEDKQIKKVGVSIGGDVQDLKKALGITLGGATEIGEMAKSLGVKTLGLRSLTALCFEKRLSKKAKLTNWEKTHLTTQQINYAATDAWIGLKVYYCLLGHMENKKKQP
jgi:ribonuclease D